MKILKLIPLILLFVGGLLTIVLSKTVDTPDVDLLVRLLVIMPMFYLMGLVLCKYITVCLYQMKDTLEKQSELEKANDEQQVDFDRENEENFKKFNTEHFERV